jgi:hypothetical protein
VLRAIAAHLLAVPSSTHFKGILAKPHKAEAPSEGGSLQFSQAHRSTSKGGGVQKVQNLSFWIFYQAVHVQEVQTPYRGWTLDTFFRTFTHCHSQASPLASMADCKCLLPLVRSPTSRRASLLRLLAAVVVSVAATSAMASSTFRHCVCEPQPA